jgi:hypothetical protein
MVPVDITHRRAVTTVVLPFQSASVAADRGCRKRRPLHMLEHKLLRRPRVNLFAVADFGYKDHSLCKPSHPCRCPRPKQLNVHEAY